ncbi:MAG: ribosome silencing factor [Oscillospiraceae bacterium]
MTSREMAEQAVRLLDNKKASDIMLLDIGKLTTLGDYFVIASGSSTTQVKALAGELEDKFTKQGIEPRRVEGESSAMWVLLDYSDVVIHIFYQETRSFYGLERLWGDASQVDISGIIKEN